MLIDAPSTLLNTIMHNKHLSHLMAKSMNELARKSPLISLCAVAFYYTRCFFHYTHGTSFSLDLKRGQLRMEVKMAATTRILQLILKKTQFRSFDRAVP